MGKFMNWVLYVGLFFLLGLWGCTSAGGSKPDAWIDFPLHNSNLPLAPLTILAHATHASGVAGINFYVDGEQIAAVSLGGNLLESASVEWTPPATGSYTIEVLGVDAAGEPGNRAQSIVLIGGKATGTSAALLPIETITITPSLTESLITATITGTLTPTGEKPGITPSATPETPQAASEPSATANQSANCRTGPITIFPAVDYLLQGEQALITGRLADNSWLLVLPSGNVSACWVSNSVVSVIGDLEVVPIVPPPPLPVTDTPTRTPTNTPTTPAPDTTKPTVQSINLNPSEIMRVMPGCPSYPRTTISTVVAVDNVAVSYVSANWTLRDAANAVVGSGSVTYTMVDSTTFQAIFGSVSYSGILTISGIVVDTSGNSTSFSQQINVIECIG